MKFTATETSVTWTNISWKALKTLKARFICEPCSFVLLAGIEPASLLCSLLITSSWSPPPDHLLLITSSWSPPPDPPPDHLLLITSSWSPPPDHLLLITSSWSPPPDHLLLISFLTQFPEEAEVRLRSYSYSSPKAKPSRPLLNRDAAIGDLAEGERPLTPRPCDLSVPRSQLNGHMCHMSDRRGGGGRQVSYISLCSVYVCVYSFDATPLLECVCVCVCSIKALLYPV